MNSAEQLNYAYTSIREQIEGGMIRPGQRLSRRTLADEFGVSPGAVLKALAQLEREGITESRPRSGTYVKELSGEDFADLCDIREMLEPYAAARAATRISSDEIQVLRDSCKRYHQFSSVFPVPTNEASAWLQHCQIDNEERLFHGTIFRASGNKLLTQLTLTLRLLSQVSPKLIYANGKWKENDLSVVAFEHEGICEAIASRNPERAFERMLHHLRGSRLILEEVAASLNAK